jgi:hypothetical protein
VVLKRLGKLVAATVLLAVVGGTGAYLRLLPEASLTPRGPAARPPVLGPFGADPVVKTPSEWTDRRAPLLREAFQREVYGRLPTAGPARVETVKALPPPAPDAVAEQWTVRVDAPEGTVRFNMVVVTPATPGPHPVIVMQTFCGNRAAMGGMEAADLLTPTPCGDVDAGLVGVLIEKLRIFGEFIARPPWDKVIDRGYAIATFYAGDLVPDRANGAAEAVARLQPDVPPADRAGAIAAWAWAYSRAIDVLETDRRLDPARQTAWGHSRNGKAALLAAAFDPRIDAVIAHQSGKGGATLTRASKGESVEQITDAYPFWFGSRYAGWAGREQSIPVDQHQLIALIAPRPVLIGTGRRDMWSGPHGAWRALEGAAPAYRLLGSPGLKQTRLEEPVWDGDLVYFLRKGRHGVTGEDWDAFLTFLDAQQRRR